MPPPVSTNSMLKPDLLSCTKNCEASRKAFLMRRILVICCRCEVYQLQAVFHLFLLQEVEGFEQFA